MNTSGKLSIVPAKRGARVSVVSALGFCCWWNGGKEIDCCCKFYKLYMVI